MPIETLNILLADDDTDDCIFFEQAVIELKVMANITTVHEGEQLMQLLTNKSKVLPDVLFLDLNMPRKNGFECLSEIKQSEQLKQLPVIVFSTSFEQDVVNSLYQNGASYFIRKPSEFSQFKKIIQHSLTLVSRGKISAPKRENFVLTIQNE
jgi:CheY-like chemotaxis protein